MCFAEPNCRATVAVPVTMITPLELAPFASRQVVPPPILDRDVFTSSSRIPDLNGAS
jgi:hypothetical protein